MSITDAPQSDKELMASIHDKRRKVAGECSSFMIGHVSSDRGFPRVSYIHYTVGQYDRFVSDLFGCVLAGKTILGVNLEQIWRTYKVMVFVVKSKDGNTNITERTIDALLRAADDMD